MSCNFFHPKIWSLGVQHQLLSRKRNYCQTPKFNLDFKKLATLCHIASMIFVSSYICKKTYKKNSFEKIREFLENDIEIGSKCDFGPKSPKWGKMGNSDPNPPKFEKFGFF